nr:MAG TPA: glyoxylate carboligase [Caudoviricetes sp.]
MGYSPETTSSVIPGSRCNVFRFFTLQRATAPIKPGLSQIAAVRQLHVERRRHWCKSEICDHLWFSFRRENYVVSPDN